MTMPPPPPSVYPPSPPPPAPSRSTASRDGWVVALSILAVLGVVFIALIGFAFSTQDSRLLGEDPVYVGPPPDCRNATVDDVLEHGGCRTPERQWKSSEVIIEEWLDD